MNLRFFISVVSIFTLLFTNLPLSLALSIDEAMQQSWQGRTQAELVSVWGQPQKTSNLPNSTTYWLNYENKSSTYVPRSYTSSSNSRYNSFYDRVNTSTTTQEFGGYNIDYACTANFMLDSKTTKINSLDIKGNNCYNTYLKFTYLSPSWWNEMKGKILRIPSGTAIPIETLETIDSQDISLGSTVVFRSPTGITNTVPFGITADQIYGEVTVLKKPRSFGRPASLTVDHLTAKLLDGTIIPLSTQISSEGKAKYFLAIVSGLVAVPFVLVPIPSFFIKGGKAVIPAGTQKTVYTAADAYVKL
jgi:hypothetical protein